MITESPFSPNRFSDEQFCIFNPNSLRLLFDIGRYCHPAEPRKSLRLFFRSLYWAKPSSNWFRYIALSPLLAELVKLDRNLPEKLHRKILRTDYLIDKRLNLLIEHYEQIGAVFASKLLQQALLKDGLLLATIEPNSEQNFTLILGCGVYPGKEGEMSITMFDAHKRELVRVCFSIISDTRGHSLYIGGLQGGNGENAREVVAEACKACHGLAPRRIVMESLFALAKHINAVRILAVSDTFHISSRKLTKHFNYDNYWLELDGRRDGDDYALPMTPKHKEYADTPSKRRAKYRRQHAILDAVHSETLYSLGSENFNETAITASAL